MAHVPHLYLQGPWLDERIDLDDQHRRHLERVLRRLDGDGVTYTDGAGAVGTGILNRGSVVRGGEAQVARPDTYLTVAVAVPASKERIRFLVEKLAELGTSRIIWLATEYGRERPPKVDRAKSWAVATLEQSRGAWLTEIDPASHSIGDLAGVVWFGRRDGASIPSPPTHVTLAIGPEGGWSDGEIPDSARTVTLSERVLRLETAAVAGAAMILSGKDRDSGHSEW